jgi:hypothetical protein
MNISIPRKSFWGFGYSANALRSLERTLVILESVIPTALDGACLQRITVRRCRDGSVSVTREERGSPGNNFIPNKSYLFHSNGVEFGPFFCEESDKVKLPKWNVATKEIFHYLFHGSQRHVEEWQQVTEKLDLIFE